MNLWTEVLPVLHLISCCSKKERRPCYARDLYCSPWFKMAVQNVGSDSWAILSARYGLVWPDQILDPYNETLRQKRRAERRAWAERVLGLIPKADRYVIWAGAHYCEFLVQPLKAELPLKGLGIGQQLAFFKARKLAMQNIHTKVCRVCRTGHSGPECKPVT